MTRPPPRSPRTDPLFPYPTLFRALLAAVLLAVPIGVVAACGTNLFRLSIDYLDTAMLGFPADITVHFAQLDWYWRLLVPALGGLLAGGLLWWDKRQPVEAGEDRKSTRLNSSH